VCKKLHTFITECSFFRNNEDNLLIFSLLSGICIGILLAMPPGPVGITAIKLGLFNGQKSGTQLAFGNAIMDFLYSLLAIFATAAATQLINSLAHTYPLSSLVFQVLIVLTLLIYGFVSLTTQYKEIDYTNPDQKFENNFLQSLKSRGPLLLGVAIALTNLANPTFIPTLAWITVQVHKYQIIQNSTMSNLIFALGFGLGNFLWIYTLVKVIVKYKERLSDKMLIRIRQFTGVTFIGFGTIMGYRLLTITKWSEIIRFIFAI
jgi:threonine/homoserine/homoserine lactone efflux protein